MGEEVLSLDRAPSKRRESVLRHRPRSPWRGAPAEREDRSVSPEYRYRTTCLSRPSRSPSPKASPPRITEYYGTAQLERRSRSPSPTSAISAPIQRIPPRPPPLPPGRGRRLPLVPGEPMPPYPPGAPMEYYPPEYDQRSRSPSPTSVYSVASYYRRPRLRRLPAIVRTSMMGPGPPFLGPEGEPSFVEPISLPTVDHSPTIPAAEPRSPTRINFPRVCASPTRGPSSNGRGLYA